MASAIDISVLGDKALSRALDKLAKPASQKRSIRPALRSSTYRIKQYAIENLSGAVVSPVTGAWLAAMAATPVRAFKRSRTRIGYGLPMPLRSELGIDPSDEWYYPAAVEYGYTRTERAPVTVEAKRPLRDAIDDNKRTEYAQIGRDIGHGIEREWRRLAR